MIGCIVASFALFWWAGSLLKIPRYRGFDASLFRQDGMGRVVIALLALVVLVFGVTVVAEIIARRFWLFAGPLAALVGLSAWSFRGGRSYFSFLSGTPASPATGAFFLLAGECLFYGLMLAALWLFVFRVFHVPDGPKERPFTLIPDMDAILVILTQAAFTAIGVIVLVPSVDKHQAVLGLAAASAIASGLTRYFHDSKTPNHWIWLAPVLVGVAGYLINGFGSNAELAAETGRLRGVFAALARPLPLDYATAGVVGALIGLAMTTHDWEVATLDRLGSGARETTADATPPAASPLEE